MRKIKKLTDKEHLSFSEKEQKEYCKTLPLNEESISITRVSGSMEDFIKARGLIQWEEALARIETRRGILANKPFDELPLRPTTKLFTRKGRLNIKLIKKLSDEELRKEMRVWIKDELDNWERIHGKEKMDDFLLLINQKINKLWGEGE